MKKLMLLLMVFLTSSLFCFADESEISKLHDIAWASVERGDVSSAVSTWKKILEIDPKNFDARYFLSIREDGVGYGFMQDRPYWSTLATEYPENILVQYQKTRYDERHERDMRESDLIKSYLAILEKDANDFLINYSLGVYLNSSVFDKDEKSKAQIYINKALELNPKSVQATFALGQLQLNQSLIKEAEATFKKALTFMPLYEKVYYNADIWNSLARLYATQGRNKEIESLRNNLANQKYGNQGFANYTQNIINTGKAYAKAGNKAQAIDMYITVIRAVDRSGYIIDDVRLKAERELLKMYQ